MRGWKTVAINEVAKIEREIVEADSIKNGTLYVGLENIQSGGDFVNVREVKPGELSSSKFKFTSKHLLYGKLRPYLAKIARPAFEGICSTDILPLLPGPELSRDYLCHYLLQPSMVAEANSRTAGANLPRLSPNALGELKIPLPQLAEQKRIAAVLDKADAIRRKRQQAIKLVDDFLRATFLDMFGDPVTNPKRWGTIRIEEVCNLVRGSSPRPQGDSRYYGGKVPRLMVADLTRDGWLVTPQIDSLTEEGAKLSRPVEASTVVMAVSGNVGVVSQLAIDACIHDGFVAFKDLNSDLVKEIYFMLCLHFMKTTHEKRKAGAIFQNLTTYDIKNMKIMAPNLSMQNKFCDIFKSSRFIGKKIESSIAILTDLFNSLTQRAFRGEL